MNSYDFLDISSNNNLPSVLFELNIFCRFLSSKLGSTARFLLQTIGQYTGMDRSQICLWSNAI